MDENNINEVEEKEENMTEATEKESEETTAEASTESAAEASAEQSAETTAETSAEQPVETPVEQPAETPVPQTEEKTGAVEVEVIPPSSHSEMYNTPAVNNPYHADYVPTDEELNEPPMGFAIGSLVLGIIGILSSCCCGVGLIPGIIGVVLSCCQKENLDGKKPGMATAGMVISIIGIVFSLGVLAIYVMMGREIF